MLVVVVVVCVCACMCVSVSVYMCVCLKYATHNGGRSDGDGGWGGVYGCIWVCVCV